MVFVCVGSFALALSSTLPFIFFLSIFFTTDVKYGLQIGVCGALLIFFVLPAAAGKTTFGGENNAKNPNSQGSYTRLQSKQLQVVE